MNFGKWIGFFAFIVSLYILWQIRLVLLLFFASVVLATSLNRLVRQFQKQNIKRGWAIALSLGILLLLSILFFLVIVPPFIDQVKQLFLLIPTAINRFREWELWLEGRLPESVLRSIQGLEGIPREAQSFLTRLVTNFFGLFSSSLRILFHFLVIFVVGLMLLANPQPYRDVFILLFPSFYRRRADEILDKCEVALGGWVTGILFNMFVIAVLSGLGLWMLNIPLALANAMLAGILTFIPNIGPALSVVPPIILALLEAPWKAVAVLVLYVVVQQIESNLLTPLVMQKQVSLLPAFTLLSQFTFAIFFEILGLFLALPIMVVLQVWLQEVLIHDILNRWDRNGREIPLRYLQVSSNHQPPQNPDLHNNSQSQFSNPQNSDPGSPNS